MPNITANHAITYTNTFLWWEFMHLSFPGAKPFWRLWSWPHWNPNNPGKNSKHTLIRTKGLRTSWKKFATLIPKNTRTCVAKQLSRFLYVSYREIMKNNLRKECNWVVSNLRRTYCTKLYTNSVTSFGSLVLIIQLWIN